MRTIKSKYNSKCYYYNLYDNNLLITKQDIKIGNTKLINANFLLFLFEQNFGKYCCKNKHSKIKGVASLLFTKICI